MKRRPGPGLLPCCCIALLLLSGIRAALHGDHRADQHYCAEDCPVCTLIRVAPGDSRQLGGAPGFPAILPAAAVPAALASRRSPAPGIPVSPVRLKIKMNR
jgi:hypothetical protein